MVRDNKINVVILEDHPMTMEGYQSRLASAGDIRVTAALRYGQELEPALDKYPADVLLLDIQVPTSADNPNPFPIWYVLPRLMQTHPGLGILVITMHDRPSLVDAALNAGVSGYILKEDYTAFQDLAAIIRATAAGNAYFSPLARQRWLRRRTSPQEPLLSPRQLEALSLCAAYPDENSSQIARHMNIAESTLRNLLSRAYLKLEVSSRAAAVTQARKLGLLPPDTL